MFTRHVAPRSAAAAFLACNDVHGHDAETAGYKIAMRQAPSKPLAPIFVLQVPAEIFVICKGALRIFGHLRNSGYFLN